MRWNLVILGSFALLLVALAGCTSDDALAGKAAETYNDKTAYLLGVFNPDKIYLKLDTNEICFEDDFKTVCEKKSMDCVVRSDSSYLCQFDQNFPVLFDIPQLIFNADTSGRLRLCVECLSPDHTCGNGVVEAGEECDDGNTVSGDGCTFDCRIQKCGNRIVEAYETCDDGNAVDGDGCSSTCVTECVIGLFSGASYHCPLVCGNGILELGEECDGSPDCRADCTLAIFREPVECYECVAEECVGFSVLGESCPPGSTDIASCSAVCGVPEPDDGIVDVVPEPEDVALCAEPDPWNLPPGTRFRDLEGGTRHVSSCEPVGSENCRGEECSRITVCHPDGSTTVSVIPCPEPEETCVDEEGVCVGDPIWRPQCFDSDEGFNPSTYGEVIQIGPDGALPPQGDFCWVGVYVSEYFCIEGSIRVGDGFNCQDLDGYCDAGRCVPGETSCTETDDGSDLLTPGVTTITTPIGSYSESDYCNFFQTGINEYRCSGNRMGYEGFLCSSPELCDAEVCHCEERAEGAVCVPGEPPVILCEDHDGGEDIFTNSWAGFLREGLELIPSFDSCASSTSVNEAICVTEHESGSVELPCPEGYNCFGGACMEEVTCTREPAGDAGGYVTDRDGVVWLDYCSDANTLEVYGCREDRTAYVVGSTPCPAGCDGERGRCL